MKRILVPCDFSEPAVQAFKFAVEIAKESGGEINLLNVVELPTLYDSPGLRPFEQSYMREVKDDVVKKFGKMRDKWAPAKVKVHTLVQFGSLMASIDEAIKAVRADLLLVGTHGASGLREFTIGSNTEKIVRRATIPVIAIKKAPKKIENIVLPTWPDLDQEELTMKVKELQNFFKANIHIVYINTPAMFRRDVATKTALSAFAKRFMLKDFTLNVYNDISEEEGIINFSKEINADLVAMRTHGRRGLAHIAGGSIAEDVVNHIECPIWTYKIK